MVSPNIDADSFGRIYVEWKDFERLTQEVMHHRDLFVQKPVIGGYYQPSAFSVLENVLTVSDDKNGLPKFFPGDFVQIRMEELDGILLVDMNGDRVEKDWVLFCYLRFLVLFIYFSCFNIIFRLKELWEASSPCQIQIFSQNLLTTMNSNIKRAHYV